MYDKVDFRPNHAQEQFRRRYLVLQIGGHDMDTLVKCFAKFHIEKL